MIGPALIILWFLIVAAAVRDLDREQTARMKAERKVRPLTQDQEAAREHYRLRDRARVDAMRATRDIDTQLWAHVGLQEAKKVWHRRNLRLLWDGTINIGETA